MTKNDTPRARPNNGHGVKGIITFGPLRVDRNDHYNCLLEIKYSSPFYVGEICNS
jgi:hypothetical protein